MVLLGLLWFFFPVSFNFSGTFTESERSHKKSDTMLFIVLVLFILHISLTIDCIHLADEKVALIK